MQTILAATDLSPRSDRALDRSIALLDLHPARLIVLHVVDEDLPSALADRRGVEAEREIDAHLSSLPESVRRRITPMVAFGRDYATILRTASERHADLIVLGMHRENPLRDLFVGTTAERVIRLGQRHVLVVKDRARSRYRRVLVAIDFSVYSRRAVEFARSFAPNAEYCLVHAYEIPFAGVLGGGRSRREMAKRNEAHLTDAIAAEMSAFLASLPEPSRLETIVRDGSVRSVLNTEAARIRADLLVIGTHGRTGVARALLGSVAQDVLSDPPCDVLAVTAW